MGARPGSIRNYGIDALRIVSMLMVVVLHVLGQGGILDSIDLQFTSIRSLSFWFLYYLCLCSVNCFALISGYVGYGSRHLPSRTMLLWIELVFFTTLENILLVAFGYANFNAELVWQSLFPVTSRYLWFGTAYIMLSIISPLIDFAIASSSKNGAKIALLGFFLLASGLSLAPWSDDPFNLNHGYSVLWLAYLYALGAFFRRYGLPGPSNSRCVLIAVACPLLNLALRCWALGLFGISVQPINSAILLNLDSYTSPIVVMQAICIVCLFARFNPGCRAIKIIKVVSPLMFGVYITHVHELVWTHVLAGNTAFASSFPAPCALAAISAIALLIFICCLAASSVFHCLSSILNLDGIFKNTIDTRVPALGLRER